MAFTFFVAFVSAYPPSEDQEEADSYTRVMAMLEKLHLTEMFPKFRAAMIKVMDGSVASCNLAVKLPSLTGFYFGLRLVNA